MKKFICILLAAVIFIVGCQRKPEIVKPGPDLAGGETPSGDLNAEDPQKIDEGDIFNMKMRESVKDDLPEADFGGAGFTVFQRTEWNYEFLAESQTGDVVNDAVYRRNLAVEERFNVKLNLVETEGIWGQQDKFVNRVKNSVSAGDDEFQLISGYAAYMPRLQTGGYLINLPRPQLLD